jgi:hypothetical protein
MKSIWIFLALSFFFAHPIQAQAENKTELRLDSRPQGANIYLNGEYVGTTRLTTQVISGLYEVQIELEGFIIWSQQVVVYGNTHTISTTLQSGDNLIRLSQALDYPQWSEDGNALRFAPTYSTDGFLVYNIEDNSITPSPIAFGLLTDDNLKQFLKIPNDPNSPQSIAYVSPSGRYIGYLTEELFLAIYDTVENQSFESLIEIPYLGSLSLPPYRLLWCDNERTIAVLKPEPGMYEFVLVNSGGIQTIRLGAFNINDSTKMSIGLVADVDDNGKALIFNDEFFGNPASGLWLVDLTTESGQKIPFDNIMSARFINDADNQIIIAFEEGIGVINLENPSEIKLIDTVIRPNWGVIVVYFSPTSNYVLIHAEDVATSYWLYKLPPLTP